MTRQGLCRLGLAAAFTILAGCKTANQPTALSVEQADLVIRNATVHTVNSEQPWAQAIAIDDGLITYVGDDRGVAAYIGVDTQVVDMERQLVLPGFQDAHIHPLEGASLETFMGCDLIEIAAADPNPENWIDKIRPCADQPRPHSWVLGGGHHNTDLLNLTRPPRELLDEAFPVTPAAFMEKSSHSMWVNSKALEVAGITRETPNPQGGIIFKDPATGEPNGILSDSAGDELMHIALAETAILQEARYDALLRSQDLLARHGITSANNARVYWDRGNLEPWLQAEREGTLKARNIMSLWTYPHMDDGEQLSQLKAMYDNDPDSLLRVSRIKFYADGVPDLNSAAVLQPYGALIFPDANPMGLNYFTEQRMAKYITELERVGFGVMIHAIGDRGVREALNAIEAAQQANPELAGNIRRHYVTHVGWVHPEDIPRFAALNIPADTQINFDGGGYDATLEVGDDFWDRLFVHTESNLDSIPEIYQTGARIVLSSDWDVSYMDPLVSIQNAVDKFSEVMTREEILAFAVKAYTYNAAYALNQEATTGSIEVGKKADIIALDKNIFAMPVEEIRNAKVIWTLLGGEEVYRAPTYHPAHAQKLRSLAN